MKALVLLFFLTIYSWFVTKLGFNLLLLSLFGGVLVGIVWEFGKSIILGMAEKGWKVFALVWFLLLPVSFSGLLESASLANSSMKDGSALFVLYGGFFGAEIVAWRKKIKSDKKSASRPS